MNSQLQQAYDELEKMHFEILDRVAPFADTNKYSLRFPNKWSVAQILTHLILAEHISLQYMKKKSLGIKIIENSGFWEDVKAWMLTLSQRVPLKYKAPKVLVENSSDKALTFSEVKIKWAILREELNSFLQQIDDEHVHKKIYKHPLAGRLNAIHAVRFMREHARHHFPQIKYLLYNTK